MTDTTPAAPPQQLDLPVVLPWTHALLEEVGAAAALAQGALPWRYVAWSDEAVLHTDAPADPVDAPASERDAALARQAHHWVRHLLPAAWSVTTELTPQERRELGALTAALHEASPGPWTLSWRGPQPQDWLLTSPTGRTVLAGVPGGYDGGTAATAVASALPGEPGETGYAQHEADITLLVRARQDLPWLSQALARVILAHQPTPERLARLWDAIYEDTEGEEIQARRRWVDIGAWTHHVHYAADLRCRQCPTDWWPCPALDLLHQHLTTEEKTR